MTKRMKKVYEGLNQDQAFTVDQALKEIKARSKVKFDETIEIAVNLGIDARKPEQSLRGVTSLPNGTGKTHKVAVFAKGPKADEAKAAGADIVGADELVDDIKAGKIEFDKCIATPDMMGVVGKVARILGPKGLMPNPKLGTVTMDVAAAVKAVKGGQLDYRSEKAGVIHAGIGKVSFTESALVENFNAFMGVIEKARPSGVKGAYIRKVSLSSTMGPGLRVEFEG